MLLGYNTNGLADHDLPSAIELVAELGYQAIAITLDHHSLNPYAPDLDHQIASMRERLERFGLEATIETGARYLLDSRHKHQPTLVSATAALRERRLDFLCRAVEIASRLEAHCVSFWAGTATDSPSHDDALDRLAETLPRLLAHAKAHRVVLAMEPEPGMAIDTMKSFSELLQELESRGVDHSGLGLTIDIGHLHCLGEVPIVDHLRRWEDRLRNVHIEDMRSGIHEHLLFGEGEIDFPPILAALGEMGYAGPVTVELSRHSHIGPEAARRAYEFLQPLVLASRTSHD